MALANGIVATLNNSGASMVMVDELNPSTSAKIIDCASYINANYPATTGRWGVFVAYAPFGGLPLSYDSMLGTFGTLFTIHAHVAVQLYGNSLGNITNYWGSASTDSGRDNWLKTRFLGDDTRVLNGTAHVVRGFRWLLALRLTYSSNSLVVTMLGVVDGWVRPSGVSEARAQRYVDRMWYVMKNHVVQAYAPAAGQTQVPYGLGAYTWKSTSAPFNVSDSTRDDAFMGSYNWYAVNGQTASRLGSVGAA